MAAKTNAQRQAEYRQRHLKGVDGNGERLNMVIGISAKRTLERLSVYYAVTQRAMLERLLREAEGVALDRIQTGADKVEDYYEGRLRLTDRNVTP